MPTTSIPRPLDFEIDGDHTKAYRYGRLYWAIGLPDGREAMINADRVDVVASGALVAWQETQLLGGEDSVDYEPLEAPRPMMVLAPGAWTHCYAASTYDDSPLVIDHLAEPRRR